jgi:hypothetical protein
MHAMAMVDGSKAEVNGMHQQIRCSFTHFFSLPLYLSRDDDYPQRTLCSKMVISMRWPASALGTVLRASMWAAVLT